MTALSYLKANACDFFGKEGKVWFCLDQAKPHIYDDFSIYPSVYFFSKLLLSQVCVIYLITSKASIFLLFNMVYTLNYSRS